MKGLQSQKARIIAQMVLAQASLAHAPESHLRIRRTSCYQRQSPCEVSDVCEYARETLPVVGKAAAYPLLC